ncbi:MAG: TonB-dependent receptor, partial [Gammaproteobacteria bacterium]|nr:TonB-dependent receptor [Gammaproteobacteria bacterium]
TLSVPASTSPSINVFYPVYGRVTAPVSAALLPRSLTTENLESTAISLQDQVDFGAWSLVAGTRFTQQKFLYGTAGTQPVDESRWSPKLALLRRLSDTGTVYANVSTGTSPNQVSSSSNQSLPSRRSAQAELGWKAAWNQGNLVSDVAIYRLNQTNMIAADQSTPLNNFDFTVTGSARSQGLEASLTGTLTERIDLAASYAYTDAKYENNPVYGGMTVPNVARHTLSLWGRYAWTPEWKTGAGVYVQSRRYADEANTTTLPGYARFDLVQSWTKKLDNGQSIELQVALRNLFDKEYFVSSHLHVNRWITPGQGRNVQVSGTYRF